MPALKLIINDQTAPIVDLYERLTEQEFVPRNENWFQRLINAFDEEFNSNNIDAVEAFFAYPSYLETNNDQLLVYVKDCYDLLNYMSHVPTRSSSGDFIEIATPERLVLMLSHFLLCELIYQRNDSQAAIIANTIGLFLDAVQKEGFLPTNVNFQAMTRALRAVELSLQNAQLAQEGLTIAAELETLKIQLRDNGRNPPAFTAPQFPQYSLPLSRSSSRSADSESDSDEEETKVSRVRHSHVAEGMGAASSGIPVPRVEDINIEPLINIVLGSNDGRAAHAPSIKKSFIRQLKVSMDPFVTDAMLAAQTICRTPDLTAAVQDSLIRQIRFQYSENGLPLYQNALSISNILNNCRLVVEYFNRIREHYENTVNRQSSLSFFRSALSSSRLHSPQPHGQSGLAIANKHIDNWFDNWNDDEEGLSTTVNRALTIMGSDVDIIDVTHAMRAVLAKADKYLTGLLSRMLGVPDKPDAYSWVIMVWAYRRIIHNLRYNIEDDSYRMRHNHQHDNIGNECDWPRLDAREMSKFLDELFEHCHTRLLANIDIHGTVLGRAPQLDNAIKDIAELRKEHNKHAMGKAAGYVLRK